MNWPMPEKDHPTAFIDVDHTLLMWGGPVGDVPFPLVNGPLITRIREMKAKGWRIAVWSYGGELHAKNAVKHCGLENIVDWCCGKPTLIIDDAPDRIWQRAEKQLP